MVVRLSGKERRKGREPRYVGYGSSTPFPLRRATFDVYVFQFLEFIRATDSKFENYDMEGKNQSYHWRAEINLLIAAWPSTIDDFVEYAKEGLRKS